MKNRREISAQAWVSKSTLDVNKPLTKVIHMKKTIPLSICLFLTVSVIAQPQKESSPDQTYTNGSKTVTTGGKNVNGEREDYVEYYDAGHNKKQMKTTTYKENGDSVITDVKYDCYGGQTSKREVRKTKDGKTYLDTYEQYDEKTKAVTQGYKIVTENGVSKTYLYNTTRDEYEPISSLPPNAIPPIDKSAVCCKPRNSIFGGYSFLSPTAENSEGIPLGVHLAYTYLVTGRFGIVGDLSLHSKKERDLRITQAFLMGGLQYYLLVQQDKKMKLLARLLAGIATDRQKYKTGTITDIQKASAFAVAFGLGIQYDLNRRIAIEVLTDYILTRFYEESLGNIRASVGVKINLGCN
jgi:hypothetical protein